MILDQYKLTRFSGVNDPSELLSFVGVEHAMLLFDTFTDHRGMIYLEDRTPEQIKNYEEHKKSYIEIKEKVSEYCKAVGIKGYLDDMSLRELRDALKQKTLEHLNFDSKQLEQISERGFNNLAGNVRNYKLDRGTFTYELPENIKTFLKKYNLLESFEKYIDCKFALDADHTKEQNVQLTDELKNISSAAGVQAKMELVKLHSDNIVARDKAILYDLYKIGLKSFDKYNQNELKAFINLYGLDDAVNKAYVSMKEIENTPLKYENIEHDIALKWQAGNILKRFNNKENEILLTLGKPAITQKPNFDIKNIPFDELSQLGISKKDFGQDNIDKLLKGEKTKFFNLNHKDSTGQQISGKFSLQRDQNNKVNLMFHQEQHNIKISKGFKR